MSSQNENPGALGGATGDKGKTAKSGDEVSTDNHAGKAFPSQAAWRERNPLKTWAHSCLRSGIRRGLIEPEPCEVCGSDQAEAHHDEYEKPLMVRWLCRLHHKQLHARRLKEECRPEVSRHGP